MALEAIKDNLKIGIRAAAKLYNVLASTLYRRRGGQPIQRDILVNSRKLMDLEKKTIV